MSDSTESQTSESRSTKLRKLARFSLRGLIVFILIVAVALTAMMSMAKHRRETIKQLRLAGALVSVESSPPWPLSLIQIDWGSNFWYPSKITIGAVIDDDGKVQVGDNHYDIESAKAVLRDQYEIASNCGADSIIFNACHYNGRFPELDLQLIEFGGELVGSVESGHWHFYQRDLEFQRRRYLSEQGEKR